MAWDPRIKFSYDFPEIVQLILKSLEWNFTLMLPSELLDIAELRSGPKRCDFFLKVNGVDYWFFTFFMYSCYIQWHCQNSVKHLKEPFR